ncbi:MAG TPA: hypothetical protein VHG28_06985 [Longimicrobiaceae bacterium]|nr:hypothetical protein [Longimicrobiaceae bacterium]
MSPRRRGGAAGVLLLLLALGAAGWYFRDTIRGLLGREDETFATAVSPEAAAQAEAKIARLQEGDSVRLSDVELTSLVRYRYQDRIPGDLHAPAVSFRGDTVRLQARVPSDRIPDVPELGRVRSFLPDTADVDITGKLQPLESGRAAFDVDRITFAGIPIPERLYPQALERMGRRAEPGLAETAYPFRLPQGVGAARVEGGYLVLSPNR